MSCSIKEAQFAVIGTLPEESGYYTDPETGKEEEFWHGPTSGVLSWHTNQLDALRALKEVTKKGGNGKVFSSPKGELSTSGKLYLNMVLQIPNSTIQQ